MTRGSRTARPYVDPPRLPSGERVDVDGFLGGAGPIEIEIGPGRGAFAIGRCAAEPSVRLLGIEIRRKWAAIVDARLAQAGLADRARVVCEDARWALGRLGPDGCAARVFLHFPDPWWKKRHHKRLLVGAGLVVEIARLLTDGGELFLQTDVPERAARYREELDAVPTLEAHGEACGSPLLAANPYGAASNRERRAQQDGLPVHRLRYRRRQRRTDA